MGRRASKAWGGLGIFTAVGRRRGTGRGRTAGVAKRAGKGNYRGRSVGLLSPAGKRRGTKGW